MSITRIRKSMAVTLIVVTAMIVLLVLSGVEGSAALTLTKATPLPTASGIWGKYLGQTCDPAVAQRCVEKCQRSWWPCIPSSCYWGCQNLLPPTPTPIPWIMP